MLSSRNILREKGVAVRNVQPGCETVSQLRILEQSQFMLIVADLLAERGASAAERLSQPDFDHRAFLEFITVGKARNFVTGVLGEARVREVFPPKYARVLLDHWRHENERKVNLWNRQHQILDQFQDSTIPVMVLKGAVLAQLLYADKRHRHQSDLDLLIKREDLDRALLLLQKQGFVLARNHKQVTANQLRCEHAVTLEQGKVKIDLHWCLRTAPAYNIDAECVWADRTVVTIDDRELNTLSNEWALTLLLLSFAHDLGRGGGKLKHAIDIYLLVRACSPEIDWERFWQARRCDGTERPSLNALAFVSKLIGPGSLPASATQAIVARRELVKVDGQGHCLFLLNEPRRSIRNALWFCRIYPLNITRDARYALNRIVTKPARIPLLISRIVRRAGQVTTYAVTKLFARELPYPMITHSNVESSGPLSQERSAA